MPMTLTLYISVQSFTMTGVAYFFVTISQTDNIPSSDINLNATNRRPQSDEESCPDVPLRSSPYTMTDRLQTAALNIGFRQAVQRL